MLDARPVTPVDIRKIAVAGLSLAFRRMTATDAVTVAQIHTGSWRSAYRGIFTDRYLDEQVADERLALWSARLRANSPLTLGLLALDATAAAGFAFACLEHSTAWGHLLQNLHVLPELRGRGIGRGLLLALLDMLLTEVPDTGLHLWVYDKNVSACRFYGRLGAERVHMEVRDTPDGGRAAASVYAWPSIQSLRQILQASPAATGSSEC